jgi:hypothetical protein
MKAQVSVETIEKEKSKLIKQSERIFEKCDHIFENKLKMKSIINQHSNNEPEIPRNDEEHTDQITKVKVKDFLV